MNPLSAALFARALEGATGALDWTDGKRRRVFFFDHGRITLVQSNLRSESAERLAELTPGLTGEALVAATGRARVAGALREPAGEARWIDGTAPPRVEPVDLAEVLAEVGTRRVPAGAYLKLLASASAWMHHQAMPPELRHYLEDLDGTRTLDEVLPFAPAEPELAERWLRVAYTMGALVDVGVEASPYEVRSVKKREREWAGGASVDDIASMISEGLGQTPSRSQAPTPADPVAARFGPVLARIRGAADHFAVLGVSWQDPPETMRRAYFTLARELHPDRFVSDSAEAQAVATELFDKVRAAWEELGDDGRRDAYIRKVIKGEKTEDELAMDKVRAILDAEGDFKKGLAEFAAGRIAQAHELFLRAADSVPEEAEFSAYAGYTTFRIHQGKSAPRAEEGVARVRAALEANERLDSAWVLLGRIHRERGDRASARDCLVKALKLRPTNPDALTEMRRLERDRDDEDPKPQSGLFSKLFGKK